MISKATARYIRVTPRKMRQVIPLIKGKRALEAIAILMGIKKKASSYIIELLKSALANAKRVTGVEQSNLYISNITAGCGPSLKRYRAASMGRASPIIKRTSHVVVELDEFKTQPVKAKPSDEKVKTVKKKAEKITTNEAPEKERPKKKKE